MVEPRPPRTTVLGGMALTDFTKEAIGYTEAIDKLGRKVKIVQAVWEHCTAKSNELQNKLDNLNATCRDILRTAYKLRMAAAGDVEHAGFAMEYIGTWRPAIDDPNKNSASITGRLGKKADNLLKQAKDTNQESTDLLMKQRMLKHELDDLSTLALSLATEIEHTARNLENLKGLKILPKSWRF